MTIEEAREAMPDIEYVLKNICHICSNVDLCKNCKMHKKANRIGYERILAYYARNEGNMKKVLRYIRKAGRQ